MFPQFPSISHTWQFTTRAQSWVAFIAAWSPYNGPATDSISDVEVDDVNQTFLSFLPPASGAHCLTPLHEPSSERTGTDQWHLCWSKPRPIGKPAVELIEPTENLCRTCRLKLLSTDTVEISWVIIFEASWSSQRGTESWHVVTGEAPLSSLGLFDGWWES